MKIAFLSDINEEGIELSDLYKLYDQDKEGPKEEKPAPDPEIRAARLLYDLSLSSSYKGYKYLKEAIAMLIIGNFEGTSFSKQLYPALAQKFNTTDQNIEKNIRFAVRKIYEINSMEKLEELFGRAPAISSRQSNVKFIALCAEKLRLER